MKLKADRYTVFLFLFFLYFIPKYLEYTTYVEVGNFLTIIVKLKNLVYILIIVYWFINQLKKKLSVSTLFLIVLVLGYFSYEAIVKERNNIFTVLLLSLIFPKEYYDDFLKKVFKVSCFMYVFTVISCKVGIISNVTSSGIKLGTEAVRNGMGFTYSGQMVMSLIPIVLLFFYIKRGKVKIYESIFWIIVDGIVFYYSRTIMGAVLILLDIILYYIITYFKIDRFIKTGKIIRYCPIVFCGITFVLLYLRRIGNAIGIAMDAICSFRFNVGNIMIDSYGINLFGTNFKDNTTYYYEILDSEYVHMLVGEGILYLIIAIGIGCVLMKYLQYKKDKYLITIFALMFFNAIVNNGIYNLVMNPFIILLFAALEESISKRKFKYLSVKQK